MDFEEYCKSFTESMPASEGIATITKGTLIQVPTERENEQAADFHFMTDVSIEVASAKIPSTANYWKQVHGKIKVIGVTWVSDENRNDVNDGFQLIRDSLSLPNVNR